MLTLLFICAAILFGIVLMLVAVEQEKPGWATLSLITALACLWFFGGINVLHLAKAHPLYALLSIAGYFVAGTLWSFAKWWFFLRNRRARYFEMRDIFMQKKGLKTWDPSFTTEFHKGSHDPVTNMTIAMPYGLYELDRVRARPRVRDHASAILIWMMYWPWSATWTIINDPVRNFFKAIFKLIQSLYEDLSKSVYSDIPND